MAMTTIPTWTLADRLRKARVAAGVGTSEMARELGCDRRTVTNYETGRTQVRRPTLAVWAMRTGVPMDWLLSGDENHDGDDGASEQVGVPTGRNVLAAA